MGISGLGDWFKKRLDDSQGAYHQLNVFDGGRTFDTNRRQVAPSVPQQHHRNVFQKGFDQVNILDNGRSWQTPTVNGPEQSSWQQGFPVLQGLVSAPAQMMNTLAAQVPQVDATARMLMADWTNNQEAWKNANNYAQAANQGFGNRGGLLNVGTYYNQQDAERGDLKTGIQKIGGGQLMTAATIAPLARFGTFAGSARLPIAAAGASMASKAGALGARAGILGAESAGYGAAHSVGRQYKDNGELNARELARDAAFGFAGGAAFPVAGAAARGGVRIAAKGADAVMDAAPDVAQAGIRIAKQAGQDIDDRLMGNPRPFRNISDDEFAAADRARRSQSGWGDVAMDGDMQVLRQVQRKLGVDPADFDAVDNALGAVRTYRTRQQTVGQGGYVGKGNPLDDLRNQLPEGYKVEADGAVFDPNGVELTTGQIQELTQASHLTQFEKAARSGDEATMQKIADANPNDGRVHIGKTKNGQSLDELKFSRDRYADEWPNAKTDKQRRFLEDKINQLDNQIAKVEQGGSTTPEPALRVRSQQTPGPQTNQPLTVDTSPQATPTGVRVQNISSNSPEFPTSLQNRGFIETIFDDPNTSTTIKQALKDLDNTYMSRNTKELQIKAANLVKEHPDIADQLARNAHDDISVAVGSELIKDLQKAGNYSGAVDVASTLAKNLTEAGRMVQAASIYGKLTPEGVLRFAQNEINKYNKATGKNIKLKPTDAERLTKMAQEISNMADGPARDTAAAKLVAEVQKTMPATLASKLATAQTMAQLLNPKTNIRNIGGNTIFGGLENVSQTLATPVDRLLSLFTKQRTTGLPNLKLQAKGVVTGGKKAVKEAYGGYSTGPKTQFDLNEVPAFRGKILGNLEKTMNATLRGADRAAYTAAFDDTLNNLMKLNKVTKPTTEMMEMAHHQGLYRTFQDTNRISTVFTSVKKGLNNIGIGNDVTGRFGLGDMVLKYPKTPANLLGRGLDYSPVGMAKALFEATKPLVGREFDQKAFVDAFSRSIVGSGGAVGLGYVLADKGIITAAPEKNKDLRNLQKTQGLGGYQINVSGLKRWVMSGFNDDAAQLRPGDTLSSYDWAQPIAIPISAGAALGKDTPTKAGKEAVNSLADSTNTLAEQPLVQGVQRFFGNTNNNGGIGGAFTGAIEDIPSSFIPTLLNQTNQLFDNTSRNMGGNSSVERATNQVKAKIPGLANDLPASVDVLGDDRERYQNGGNNLFNVLLNPAFISKYEGQPAAQEALDLYNRTGETKQTPNTVPRKITITGADGMPQDIQLTGQQQGDYQRYVGQFTNQAIQELVKHPEYTGLPDADKVNILSNIQTKANEAAKIQLFGDNPKDMSSGAAQILGRSAFDPGVGDAQDKIALEQFKSSDERSMILGDTYYFKKRDGSVSSAPKIQYEYELKNSQLKLQMDNAKAGDDVKTWMSLAEQKIAALEEKKKLYDPVTEADAINSINLEQQNLMQDLTKYAGYGGFKKGRSGGRGKNGVNLPNISVDLPSGLFAPVVANTAYSAPKLRLQGGRNIRVGRAKSNVKLKAPKRLA